MKNLQFTAFSSAAVPALKLDENWRFTQFEKLQNAIAGGNAQTVLTVDFEYNLRSREDNKIIVPAGTQKTIVEFILAGTGETTWRSHIEVGENATLNRVVVQIAPAGTAVLTDDEIVAAGTQACVKTTFVNCGGAYVRSTITTCAQAERVLLDTQIVNCAVGTQIVDVRTQQFHNAQNTVSKLLCKNVLSDAATTIFSGNIIVTPNGQKTCATQTCNNLSLSENATTHSMPGLEIDANDVQCSHGATNSSLDNEQLFYLLQRGIPENQARQLLVQAFVNETFETLGNEPLAEFLRERVF